MKTMVDFIIDVSHLGDLRQDFLNAVKKANSSKDMIDFFKKVQYDVTDDECMRIYENNEKIVNNPYVGKQDVKGY